MSIFKNRISMFIILVLCYFVTIRKVWAIDYAVRQITSNDNWDIEPQIHNGQVVWLGYGSDGVIFLYDGNMIFNLPSNRYSYSPKIYNGQVVWYGWDGNKDDDDFEIFLYDSKNTIQLTNNDYSDLRPKIHNGQVVWHSYAGKDWEIFLYDGSRVVQLTNNDYSDTSPQIHNGQIVWQGYDGHDYEIFFYDGKQTIQLTNNEYSDYFPKIHNGQVVWRGYDGHDDEIFLYDGSRTIQVTNNAYHDTSPEIYNGQIAWMSVGSDIHSYEVFFFDGIRILQLTNNDYDDGGIQIYDGQIVWQGHDGHDYEIFLYDDEKTIQLTNNNYNDSLPKIHNGQIVWQGYDGHDYEIFLATSAPPLVILDGIDFSSEREVSNDPEKLATGGTPAEGAVTDGTTRLLLRLSVNKYGLVTFSIQGTGDTAEDGILRSIDGSQQGNSITVNTVEVNGKNYAFAIYQAPEDFVRRSYQEEDKKASERTLSIKVESNSISPIQQEIKLVRPPLILVHGLWSSPEMWRDFKIMLQNKIPGLQIFTVDYRNTNSNYFLDNEDVPYLCKGDNIKKVKGIFRSDKIAMIQADVLGHSTGGVLSRQWGGLLNAIYKRNDNFETGDIHKLITLDSPHFGSFLADFAIGFIDTLAPIIKNRLLNETRKIGFAIDKGAIEDLQTMSAAIIYLNSVPTDSASHAIVGDFVVNVDLSLIAGKIGNFFKILKHYGFDTNVDIIPGASDLVVSTKSQAGRLLSSASSTFSHHHMAATSEEVVNKTVELLNTAADNSSFESGFPVNKWPEW